MTDNQLIDEMLGVNKDNPQARSRVKGWLEKARKAHGDAGNYFVRMLQDEFGLTADERSGVDWGNEPDYNHK